MNLMTNLRWPSKCDSMALYAAAQQSLLRYGSIHLMCILCVCIQKKWFRGIVTHFNTLSLSTENHISIVQSYIFLFDFPNILQSHTIFFKDFVLKWKCGISNSLRLKCVSNTVCTGIVEAIMQANGTLIGFACWSICDKVVYLYTVMYIFAQWRVLFCVMWCISLHSEGTYLCTVMYIFA